MEYKEKYPEIRYFFHAGETLNFGNDNILTAIALGTERIGHAVSLIKKPLLIEEVKKRDICLEINPLSNHLLGYTRDLHHHPAQHYMAYGLKLSINPDDYLIWDEKGVTIDYLISVLYWNFDLKDLKTCLLNSISSSSFS